MQKSKEDISRDELEDEILQLEEDTKSRDRRTKLHTGLTQMIDKSFSDKDEICLDALESEL